MTTKAPAADPHDPGARAHAIADNSPIGTQRELLAPALLAVGAILIAIGLAFPPDSVICVTAPCPQEPNDPLILGGIAVLLGIARWIWALRRRSRG